MKRKLTKGLKPNQSADLVLREVWRAKDALSVARSHSIDKLFADLRKREKKSGHPVVNLQTKSAGIPVMQRRLDHFFITKSERIGKGTRFTKYSQTNFLLDLK